MVVLMKTEQGLLENSIHQRDPRQQNFEFSSMTPLMSSFIASLACGALFRVSIHSWDPPTPSDIVQNHKTMDEAVIHEATIYVDGVIQGLVYCYCLSI